MLEAEYNAPLGRVEDHTGKHNTDERTEEHKEQRIDWRLDLVFLVFLSLNEIFFSGTLLSGEQMWGAIPKWICT